MNKSCTKKILYVFSLFVFLFSNASVAIAAEANLTEKQWFEQGNQFLVKKDYDNAIKAYSETIRLNPKHVDAYNRRGLIYKLKAQYDLAIIDFTKVIEHIPANANLYYNRGDSYFLNKQYEIAVTDFSKAIELNPKYTMAYVRRGLSYYDIVTQAYFKSAEKNVPLAEIMTESQRFSISTW